MVIDFNCIKMKGIELESNALLFVRFLLSNYFEYEYMDCRIFRHGSSTFSFIRFAKFLQE